MNTTLYPGIPFSPQAQLTNNIGAADTIIEVSDVSAFPPAPNLATIGTDEEGETILYTAKTKTALSGCQRGVEGEARGWTAGELIGRNFTAKDHADLIAAATEAYGAAEAAQEAAAAAGSDAATKQPKLTGQTGQVVGFGADGAAVAVPGWSNPNLLLNWDFRNPVNRNGKTAYVGAGYTIDRWYSNGNGNGKIQLVETGIAIDGIGEDGVPLGFFQAFESVFCLGKIVTTSALSADGELFCASGVFPSSGSEVLNCGNVYWEIGRLSGLYGVMLSTTYPNAKIFAAVKLELGPVQTLARQDTDGNWVLNDPPDYALQYALCSLYSPSTGEWVGNQHSNPNLLDNWYFPDPVNQRGQTEYVSRRVQQYTIDRWISAGDTAPTWGLYLEDGGIRLSKGSAFQQKMDKAPPDGTVLTFSALIDWVVYSITFAWNSSTGYQRTNLPNGFALSRNGLNGYTQIFNANGTGSEIVQAAKLELGPVQTLAHQDADGNWVLNDPPPNKALELAKCQRYQQVLNAGFTCRATIITSSAMTFLVPTSVTFRSYPAIAGIGSLIVRKTNAENQSGFSFSTTNSGSGYIRITATKENHGMTDAELFVTGGSVILDANL